MLKSYLQERTQYVYYNNVHSCAKSISSDVPQGSSLGPLLFSIYINDLPSVFSGSYHLYADDVQIYQSCNLNDISLCVQSLNIRLSKISEWVINNRQVVGMGSLGRNCHFDS